MASQLGHLLVAIAPPPRLRHPLPLRASSAGRLYRLSTPPPLSSSAHGRARRSAAPGATMWALDGVAHDVFAAALTSGVAWSLLRFWEELAKRDVFEQVMWVGFDRRIDGMGTAVGVKKSEKMNRKLVHISVGLTFMLFWPLFSSGHLAPFLAALAPGINIIRMLLLGLGIWRNDAMVKSMSRHGDYRELLKGPLYYACTITLATSAFWRTSPIAIAAICNLCAGDGMADIVGRRFGRHKLPFNPGKSYEGSIAMASAGFLASIWYMYYYSLFGLVEVSWGWILGFLFISVVATVVESLPISSELDDNLTVPLTSFVAGSLIF